MDVTVPIEILPADTEGAISVWLFKSGEAVVEGDVLAEIMNQKAATELVASASGRLTILVPAETAIMGGQLIARID